MLKSEKLKMEMVGLTDSFAIKCMKQRIALAEAKEKNSQLKIVDAVTLVIDKINEMVNDLSHEMMTVDWHEEKERTNKIHNQLAVLIDGRIDLIVLLEKIESN